MTAGSTNRRHTWLALALTAFGLLYAVPYYPEINNPNENVRLYMTAALVEHGTYEIDGLRDRWGWVNDAATHHGHFFSVKAPGTSLLGVPAYGLYFHTTRLFGTAPDRDFALWLCRLTATILPTLLWLFFFHRWITRQTRHRLLARTTFLSVAFGSLLYGYSILFVSHTMSAVCAFGAFMLLHGMGQRRTQAPPPGRVFLAGLLTASVTLFEYPGLLVSVVLAFYGLRVLGLRRGLFTFACGALIPTLLMMHFQWSAFENPFMPGHLYVENQAFREAHLEGIYGATGFDMGAAMALLLDPGSGLFPLTPLLAFAVIGFPRLIAAKETRMPGTVALACVLLTVIVIASMNNWRGGWTIGPRYLATVVPFVAWAALSGLDLLAVRWPRITAAIALGCTAAAFFASGLPSVYYPHLPPEFTHPLSQLFPVLLAHDYAPHNAANLLGWFGTASMLPLLVLALCAFGWALWSTPLSARDRISVTIAACLTAGLILGPLGAAPATSQEADGAVAFVTRHWSPKGHDRASKLEVQRGARSRPDFDADRALEDVYRKEGREQEARRVIRAHGVSGNSPP